MTNTMRSHDNIGMNDYDAFYVRGEAAVPRGRGKETYEEDDSGKLEVGAGLQSEMQRTSQVSAQVRRKSPGENPGASQGRSSQITL